MITKVDDDVDDDGMEIRLDPRSRQASGSSIKQKTQKDENNDLTRLASSLIRSCLTWRHLRRRSVGSAMENLQTASFIKSQNKLSTEPEILRYPSYRGMRGYGMYIQRRPSGTYAYTLLAWCQGAAMGGEWGGTEAWLLLNLSRFLNFLSPSCRSQLISPSGTCK